MTDFWRGFRGGLGWCAAFALFYIALVVAKALIGGVA